MTKYILIILPRDFKIYYSENVDDSYIDSVINKLKEVYGLNFRIVGLRIPRHEAKGVLEGTYDGRKLLQNMLLDGISLFLWIIDAPISVEGNLVYGYAKALKGAIITTNAIEYPALVAKLAIHYVGVIIGLTHCNNKCVMRNIDCFQELIDLPSTLCQTCTLRYRKIKYRFQ